MPSTDAILHLDNVISKVTDESRLSPEDKECGLTAEGFYFWDETHTQADGPHESEKLAREALSRYLP